MTSVLIRTQTLTIYVHTKEDTVIKSHFCAQNAVKGLSGCSRENDIWIQMSAMETTRKSISVFACNAHYANLTF